LGIKPLNTNKLRRWRDRRTTWGYCHCGPPDPRKSTDKISYRQPPGPTKTAPRPPRHP
jgi:hypothetical protein